MVTKFNTLHHMMVLFFHRLCFIKHSSARSSPMARFMKPGFDPCVGKIPWRRERLPTPVLWPGESHGCIM